MVKDSDTDVILKTARLSVNDGLITLDVDIAGSKELYVYVDSIEDNGSWFVPLTTSYFK